MRTFPEAPRTPNPRFLTSSSILGKYFLSPIRAPEGRINANDPFRSETSYSVLSPTPPPKASLKQDEFRVGVFCIDCGFCSCIGICHGAVLSAILVNIMGFLAQAYSETHPETKPFRADFK